MPSTGSRQFTLEEARALLPTIKRLTADAVRRTESLAAQLQGLSEDDAEHDRLTDELARVASAWAASVRALQVEAKGLWLVDFDNGEGYYCWCYPEDSLNHYHGYEDGFRGRVPIM